MLVRGHDRVLSFGSTWGNHPPRQAFRSASTRAQATPTSRTSCRARRLLGPGRSIREGKSTTLRCTRSTAISPSCSRFHRNPHRRRHHLPAGLHRYPQRILFPLTSPGCRAVTCWVTLGLGVAPSPGGDPIAWGRHHSPSSLPRRRWPIGWLPPPSGVTACSIGDSRHGAEQLSVPGDCLGW